MGAVAVPAALSQLLGGRMVGWCAAQVDNPTENKGRAPCARLSCMSGRVCTRSRTSLAWPLVLIACQARN